LVVLVTTVLILISSWFLSLTLIFYCRRDLVIQHVTLLFEGIQNNAWGTCACSRIRLDRVPLHIHLKWRVQLVNAIGLFFFTDMIFLLDRLIEIKLDVLCQILLSSSLKIFALSLWSNLLILRFVQHFLIFLNIVYLCPEVFVLLRVLFVIEYKSITLI